MEPKKIKSVTVSIVSPFICHEVMRPDATIFVFCMLSFKSAFSLSSSPSLRGSLFPLPSLSKGDVISEVIDISPGNIDSQLAFHPVQHFA